MTSVADLRRVHAEALNGVIHHPFLIGIRQGTLPKEAFFRWLAQDYLFVGDLLRFQALLLAHAPREDQRVLAGGLVALEAELGWFEKEAFGLGVSLSVPWHPDAFRYAGFLEYLKGMGYPYQILALWGLELVYLEGWSGARGELKPYSSFALHWSEPAYKEYVEELERAADRAFKGIELSSLAQTVFLSMLNHESAFFSIA
jgi:thiaminase/transcriptional activator TenA